jgi:MutS domain V
MSITVYQNRQNDFEQKTKRLSRQLSLTGIARLLSFVLAMACIYFAITTKESAWPVMSALLLILFVVAVRYYNQRNKLLEHSRAMADINTAELAFLESGQPAGQDGAAFTDHRHAYSFDIDVFGPKSLFEHLDRCTTIPGREALAKALTDPDIATIKERQEAIATLQPMLDFRQNLLAHGAINPITEPAYASLLQWLSAPATIYGKKGWRLLIVLLPLVWITSTVLWLVTDLPMEKITTAIFIINLVVTGSLWKIFKTETTIAPGVSRSLQQLAAQLRVIEQADFNAPLLRALQLQLTTPHPASTSIARLAMLFNNLDSIYNLPASTLLNGALLFHPHQFVAIEKWKAQCRSGVLNWLSVTGEMEALCALANFAYNNPGYTQPVVVDTPGLEIMDMGHPLINAHKRICNNLSLHKEKFIVLTGSNMSGKSTFLRTLAINLVLAKAGSVVCATSFYCYPFAIFVSMRINDSLADDESFFYAELKRLQQMMDYVQQKRQVLVLLDEILRGTNSNDKHKGTVGLIRKLAAMQVPAIIATHDVTIGELSSAYPGYMTNKCFEAQISADTIYFDYQLKEGVCRQLSASFLMEKMGIIEKSSPDN